MTDVIRKTYFYKHAQSREFHVALSLPEKAWYATADNLFELARPLRPPGRGEPALRAADAHARARARER